MRNNRANFTSYLEKLKTSESMFQAFRGKEGIAVTTKSRLKKSTAHLRKLTSEFKSLAERLSS